MWPTVWLSPSCAVAIKSIYFSHASVANTLTLLDQDVSNSHSL